MQNRIAISSEQPLSIASKRHIAVCHKLSQFLSVRLTKVFRAHLYAVSQTLSNQISKLFIKTKICYLVEHLVFRIEMSAKARRQSMRLASSASSKTEQENSGERFRILLNRRNTMYLLMLAFCLHRHVDR